MVEYTGFRFLFFFIGEFGTAFAFAALASTLFLGGWSLPWRPAQRPRPVGPFAAEGDVRRVLDVLGALHHPLSVKTNYRPWRGVLIPIALATSSDRA
jgi:hypothetical protein